MTERMIDSEATTAGKVRQSSEGGERCPRCGATTVIKNGHPTRLERGGRVWISHDEVDCLRNQLAQAKERADELQRQIDEDDDKWTRYNDLYVEARGEIIDLQLHNAQLRELLDRHQWSVDGCPECGEFESDGHAEWCEIAAALSSSPANPVAVVVEAVKKAQPWLRRLARVGRYAMTDGGDVTPEQDAAEIVKALANLPGGGGA